MTALLVGIACATVPLEPQATSTPTCTPSPSVTPLPTATPEPADTGWMHVHPSVELRRIRVEIGELIERVTIARVDPEAVLFRVHYDPVAPRPVSAWAEHLDPVLVTNGSYFSEENVSIGLLISDGRVWGTPYGSYAGLFAVTGDEQVRISWLREQPYDRNEPLKEAIQSFPVLVKPGGVMGFPADGDDGRPSRRSVIAQDVDGRILFIVAPNGYFSLHTLARFLAESDLGIDVALNLDGGTSAGLWVRGDSTPLVVDSLVSVPSIIAVYPR